MMEGYADDSFERELKIKFGRTRHGVGQVQKTLEVIARNLGAEGYVQSVTHPPKGLLLQPLSQHQRRLLNILLGPQYAARNAEQQDQLRKVTVSDNGQEMADLALVLDDRGGTADFSDSRFHEACGAYANHPRIFALRKDVAHRVAVVCRAVNKADLLFKIEDCWRPEDVQKGLLLRRIIGIAVENPDWPVQKVRLQAMSLTAPAPGLAGHQAGAAIDWTLHALNSNQEPTDLGNEYAEGGAVCSIDFPYLTYNQWRTRVLFMETMRLAQLKILPTENWHASHGDRGMGIDRRVLMSETLYGPIQSFNLQDESIETYAAEDIEKFYLSDEQVTWLVQASRMQTARRNHRSQLHIVRQVLAGFRQQDFSNSMSEKTRKSRKK